MGRRIGNLHPLVVRQPDDSDPDEIGQIGEITQPLIERIFGGRGASPQTPGSVYECVPGEITGTFVGLDELIGEGVKRAASRDGNAGRHGDQDGLQADESDDDPVHGKSMA